MSLHPQGLEPIPEETARVAQAAFPHGTLCMRVRDALGTVYRADDFADLYPSDGHPAEHPWRLALVTVLLFVENLTDRQATEAVRARIDWKYALSLELTDPGFDFTVLSQFRTRLLTGGNERRLLDRLLEVLKEQRLLKARGRQRTDSTHVLAAVRELDGLERVGETLRQALNVLAQVAPEWLQTHIEAAWAERYGRPFYAYRLPRGEAAVVAFAEQIGRDGTALLEAIRRDAPAWLAQVPAVETLRRIWLQRYEMDGTQQVRWRRAGNLPPGARQICSPYDPEARFSQKRQTTWVGYKVQLTETCDPEGPLLVTDVQTTEATTQDVDVVEVVHQALAQRGVTPATHLVDLAYMSGEMLVSAQAHDIDLVGPMRGDPSWQAHAAGGFSAADFQVEWATRRVTCPQGKTNSRWHEFVDWRGKPAIQIGFLPSDCLACAVRARCTRSARTPRVLTLPSQAEYEALRQARERQQTDAFFQLYHLRAGVEGLVSQAVNAHGLRRSRYRGLAKTRLQHVATAAALNLSRVVAWLDGAPRARTRVSPLAALFAA
jgi:transposase